MIGVIGATGNVGSVLTQKLVQTGEEVVAVSHGGPEAPSVRNVRADITQPQTIEAALRGADAVFLLVAVEAHDGIDPDALIPAIERTGAARIVLLSSMGTVSRPQAHGYESLRHVEAAVRRSKLEVTILRPTGFASNTLAWVPSVRAKREVAAPFGDIAIPIVDPADIAEVAAVALRGGHAGAIYDLTGPEPITPRAQARDLGEALGVSLKFTEIGRADAARRMVEHMPADMAEATLDIAGTPNEIERRVSPDIERVLGRPAAPYAAWVRRNIAAFADDPGAADNLSALPISTR